MLGDNVPCFTYCESTIFRRVSIFKVFVDIGKNEIWFLKKRELPINLKDGINNPQFQESNP